MRAVLDASVVIRAVVDEDKRSAGWLTRVDEPGFHASVPDLIFAEVGHALLRYLRSGFLGIARARDQFEFVCALPLDVQSMGRLAPTAFEFALDRQLSMYDAFYAVLAEAEDAVLVTGDRPLAAAVKRAELV